MVLVLLQNAWSDVWGGEEWPRKGWLSALAKCRTGKRLVKCLPIEDFGPLWKGEEYWVDNTTPTCGDGSSSVVKPDVAHVIGLLHEKKPTLVIACGKQAHEVISSIGTHVNFEFIARYNRYSQHCRSHDFIPKYSRIYMPHPAMRLLTNTACDTVKLCVRRHLEDVPWSKGQFNATHYKVSPDGQISSI